MIIIVQKTVSFVSQTSSVWFFKRKAASGAMFFLSTPWYISTVLNSSEIGGLCLAKCSNKTLCLSFLIPTMYTQFWMVSLEFFNRHKPLILEIFQKVSLSEVHYHYTNWQLPTTLFNFSPQQTLGYFCTYI